MKKLLLLLCLASVCFAAPSPDRTPKPIPTIIDYAPPPFIPRTWAMLIRWLAHPY